MASTQELREIFPSSETQGVPTSVSDELGHDEQVVWIGGPARWGLFRATPFLLIIAGAFGYLAYLAAGSDASVWQYLTWILSVQSGTDALIIPGLAAGYALILGLAMRDPRNRWMYVVTDRRLMTFFKGRKLRETGTEKLNVLQSIQGLEGRLRDIGDVVWSRGHGDYSSSKGGPDQGRRGFRGMQQPDVWNARLLEWGAGLAAMAASHARTFETQVSNTDSDSNSVAGTRHLVNRRFGFSMTIPAHWVGRIGLQESAPFRILSLETPFKQTRRLSNEPLHKPPESWNFIAVAGRSGMRFTVNINQGPPIASFETSRDKVGKTLIDPDGDRRGGPLTGYSVDYRYLDRFHCRFAMLAGEGFHMLAKITIPPDQADDLLPAVNAVFDSIRSV